jgi:hypothetical protein
MGRKRRLAGTARPASPVIRGWLAVARLATRMGFHLHRLGPLGGVGQPHPPFLVAIGSSPPFPGGSPSVKACAARQEGTAFSMATKSLPALDLSQESFQRFPKAVSGPAPIRHAPFDQAADR